MTLLLLLSSWSSDDSHLAAMGTNKMIYLDHCIACLTVCSFDDYDAHDDLIHAEHNHRDAWSIIRKADGAD